MLRKCYMRYIGRRGTAPGGLSGIRPARPHPHLCPGLIRAGRAGSWNYLHARDELEAGGLSMLLGIAGGLILSGIIFAGFVGFSLPVFGTLTCGILLMGLLWIKEKEEEQREKAWRKSYPKYKY